MKHPFLYLNKDLCPPWKSACLTSDCVNDYMDGLKWQTFGRPVDMFRSVVPNLFTSVKKPFYIIWELPSHKYMPFAPGTQLLLHVDRVMINRGKWITSYHLCLPVNSWLLVSLVIRDCLCRVLCGIVSLDAMEAASSLPVCVARVISIVRMIWEEYSRVLAAAVLQRRGGATDIGESERLVNLILSYADILKWQCCV